MKKDADRIEFQNSKRGRRIVRYENNKVKEWTYQKGSGIRTKDQASERVKGYNKEDTWYKNLKGDRETRWVNLANTRKYTIRSAKVSKSGKRKEISNRHVPKIEKKEVTIAGGRKQQIEMKQYVIEGELRYNRDTYKISASSKFIGKFDTRNANDAKKEAWDNFWKQVNAIRQGKGTNEVDSKKDPENVTITYTGWSYYVPRRVQKNIKA